MKKRGISLIVLVITIVIVIILAGAVILNLSKNNPINQARQALILQDTENLQGMYDAKVAQVATSNLGYPKLYTDSTYGSKLDKNIQINSENAKIGKIYYMAGSEKGCIVFGKEGSIDEESNIKYSYLNQELPIYHNSDIKWYISQNGHISVYEYEKVEVGEEVTKENSTTTGKEPTYDNPVIPVGFKTMETAKATWKDSNNDGKPDGWNNGLVIQDASGNEYVWVPVDGTNIKYESWDNGVDAKWTVKDTQVEDDELPAGVTSETYQIGKYQGFYVARYEAGLPDSQTTDDLMLTKVFDGTDNNKTDIGKAQSKPGKIVWNRIDYNNAKTVAENVISNTYVQTGLVTERQFDTMLMFIEKDGVNVRDDSTSWGNYYNKYGYEVTGYYRTESIDIIYTNGTYKKENDGYLLLQTGKFGEVVAEGSPKNLFDVAGNVWEWQASTVKEKGGANTAVGNKILRAGGSNHYGDKFVVSYRSGDTPATNTPLDAGFRFVLYIK